jgi:hypothetical protein
MMYLVWVVLLGILAGLRARSRKDAALAFLEIS